MMGALCTDGEAEPAGGRLASTPIPGIGFGLDLLPGQHSRAGMPALWLVRDFHARTSDRWQAGWAGAGFGVLSYNSDGRRCGHPLCAWFKTRNEELVEAQASPHSRTVRAEALKQHRWLNQHISAPMIKEVGNALNRFSAQEIPPVLLPVLEFRHGGSWRSGNRRPARALDATLNCRFAVAEEKPLNPSHLYRAHHTSCQWVASFSAGVF